MSERKSRTRRGRERAQEEPDSATKPGSHSRTAKEKQHITVPHASPSKPPREEQEPPAEQEPEAEAAPEEEATQPSAPMDSAEDGGGKEEKKVDDDGGIFLVDITGIDKATLLRALWNNAFESPLAAAAGNNRWEAAGANQAINKGYIDYYCGRLIKMDLSKDIVDSENYDKDSKIPVAAVVAQLRGTKAVFKDTPSAASGSKVLGKRKGAPGAAPSVSEEKARIANEAIANKKWDEGYTKGNVNIFISLAYKWRFILNMDPRRDLVFTVTRPATNKRRRGGKKAADIVFVNCKFVKDAEGGWNAEICYAVSDVMSGDLGFGNWAQDPKNKGKDFLKARFQEAQKTICISARYFTAKDEKGNELKVIDQDEKGRNKNFMDSAAKEKQIAEHLVEKILRNEDGENISAEYTSSVRAECLAAEASERQMKYGTSKQIWADNVTDGKMTEQEYNTKLDLKKAELLIVDAKDADGNDVEEVDLEALETKLDEKKLVAAFMKRHYTPSMKHRKADGMEYLTFQAKVFRKETAKEAKEGKPVFAHPLCKAVYDATGKKEGEAKLVYNQHKWENMADWGKTEAKTGASTPEERKAAMAKDFDRSLDQHTKVALVCTLGVFVQSPQKTVGFRKEFNRIIVYQNPTAEDVQDVKAQQGSRVQEADKLQVPGASEHAATEISKPVVVKAAADVERMARSVRLQVEQEANEEEEEEKTPAAAAPKTKRK
jgi:hypothetical protein